MKKLENGKEQIYYVGDDVHTLCIGATRSGKGTNGLFVSMPSHKNADGEFKDICFPINSATRTQIQNEVLSTYEKALQEQENAPDNEDGSEKEKDKAFESFVLDPDDELIKGLIRSGYDGLEFMNCKP